MKIINGQGAIRAGRVSNFYEINKRACPFIRQVRVATFHTPLNHSATGLGGINDSYASDLSKIVVTVEEDGKPNKKVFDK